MMYLILAIIMGTVVTAGYKYITLHSLDGNVATIVNYAAAFSVACCLSFRKGSMVLLGWGLNVRDSRIGSGGGLYSTRWIIYVVGILMGMVFLGNVLLIKDSVGKNGAGNTDFFNRMGFLVCIVVSVYIWDELLTPCQFSGIVMLMAGFLLMMREFRSCPIGKPVYFVFLVLIGGLRDLCNKIYTYYALPEYKIVFLAAAYFTALMICFLIFGMKYKNGSWHPSWSGGSLTVGFILGIANVMNTSLQLKSLELIDASIVIPVFAAGTLLMGNIVNTLLFRERVRITKALAVLLASGSIVLMNL